MSAYETLPKLRCRVCGEKTRLFGIENHPCVADTSVFSYVCTACDAVQVDVVTPSKVGEDCLRTSEGQDMSKQLANGAFDPEMTGVLAAAFERAWQTLQGTTHLDDADRTETLREVLARAVIVVGRRQGANDAEQLAVAALAVVGSHVPGAAR